MKSKTEHRTDHVKDRIDRRRLMAMTVLMIPVVLMCSCDSISEKYNFADGSRPADEAILTGHETRDDKANIIYMPSFTLDDHFSHISPQMKQDGSGSFEVRLMPGIHKIHVEPLSLSFGNILPAQKRFITFEAVAGRHYVLKLEILDFDRAHIFYETYKWSAKIVEIETGKEFLFDAA